MWLELAISLHVLMHKLTIKTCFFPYFFSHTVWAGVGGASSFGETGRLSSFLIPLALFRALQRAPKCVTPMRSLS